MEVVKMRLEHDNVLKSWFALIDDPVHYSLVVEHYHPQGTLRGKLDANVERVPTCASRCIEHANTYKCQ